MAPDLSRAVKTQRRTRRQCRISAIAHIRWLGEDQVAWSSAAQEEHEERVTRVTPRTGVPRSRSGSARRRSRLLALGAVALAAVAIYLVISTQGGPREYSVIMQN